MSHHTQDNFVPLSSLEDAVVLEQNASLIASVTLIWPYSSSAGSAALLLAEPDFRLRNHRGQVRVKLQGAAARAVARSGIEIGDNVELDLAGARWTDEIAPQLTPGRSVSGQLVFQSRIKLRILRAGASFAVIDVNEPSSPSLRDAENVERAFATPYNRSPAKSAFTDEWTSPAFRRKPLTVHHRPFGLSLFGDNDFHYETGTHKRRRFRQYDSGRLDENTDASDGENGERLHRDVSPSRPREPTNSTPLFPSPLPHPQTLVASSPLLHAGVLKKPIISASDSINVVSPTINRVKPASLLGEESGDVDVQAGLRFEIEQAAASLAEPLEPLSSSRLNLSTDLTYPELTQEGSLGLEHQEMSSSLLDLEHRETQSDLETTELLKTQKQSHHDNQRPSPHAVRGFDDEGVRSNENQRPSTSLESVKPNLRQSIDRSFIETSGSSRATEPGENPALEHEGTIFDGAPHKDNQQIPVQSRDLNQDNNQTVSYSQAEDFSDLTSREVQTAEHDLQQSLLSYPDVSASDGHDKHTQQQQESLVSHTRQESSISTEAQRSSRIPDHLQETMPTPQQSQEEPYPPPDADASDRRRSNSTAVGSRLPPTPQISNLSTERQAEENDSSNAFKDSKSLDTSSDMQPATSDEVARTDTSVRLEKYTKDERNTTEHAVADPQHSNQTYTPAADVADLPGGFEQREPVVNYEERGGFIAGNQVHASAAEGEESNIQSENEVQRLQQGSTRTDQVDYPTEKLVGSFSSAPRTDLEFKRIARPSLTSEAVAMLTTAGFRSSMGYYSPLDALQSYFKPSPAASDTRVDVFVVMKDSSSPPVKAKNWPKDWFTAMDVIDPSRSQQAIKVQCFRPYRNSLPSGRPGDIVILRDFHVRSMQHKLFLISGESSSWLVWKLAPQHDVPEAVNAPSPSRNESQSEILSTLGEPALEAHVTGPPVEIGPEERMHALALKSWWLSLPPSQDQEQSHAD